jgi:ferredoxin
VENRAVLFEAAFVDQDANPPKFFNVKLLTQQEERSVRVAGDQHIWDAAFEQGVDLPALCHQGWCLTCACHIEGPGEVNQADSLAFFPQDREARFALLCTGQPCSDLTIRTHQAVEMRKHRLKNGLPSPYSQGLKP